jgi:pilus assembly protein Flp/PilA
MPVTASFDRYGEESLSMLYLPREDGQGLVEYALILVLVAIVVMALVGIIGGGIGNIFSNIVNTL